MTTPSLEPRVEDEAERLVDKLAHLLLDHPNPASPLVRECVRYAIGALRAAERRGMEQASEPLRWLVNVLSGVGKAGGEPEPGELEAAIEAGKAAIR